MSWGGGLGGLGRAPRPRRCLVGRCEVGWCECLACLVERHVEVDAQGVVDQLVHYEARFGPDGQVVLELEDE